MKNLLSLSFLLLLTACGTLAPEGIYKGDEVLYNADKTITSSYKIFHAFVSWEYKNRPALKNYPEITQAADVIRLNSRRWIATSIALRDAYKLTPSAENKQALALSVDIITTALSQATIYISTPLVADKTLLSH